MTDTDTAPQGAGMDARLARHPFFTDLPPASLARLAACASDRTHAAGDMLFHAGGDADGFFILCQGRVVVESKRPGAPSVVLQTLHETEVLGWSWLTPPYRWAFDARAATPVTVIAFDAAGLRTAFAADPVLGLHVVTRFAGVMGERLRAAHMRMLEMEAG